MEVLRERSFHWIAQQRNQQYSWAVAMDACWGFWMKQVVRGDFPSCLAWSGVYELRFVPGMAALIFSGEVMQLFACWQVDVWMLLEQVIKTACSSFLSAYSKKMWFCRCASQAEPAAALVLNAA